MSERSVVAALRAAAAAVEKADIPRELQGAAFVAAFWADRASGSPIGTAVTPRLTSVHADVTGEQGVDEGGTKASIVATKLGASIDDIELVYEFSDPLRLLVAPSNLPSSKREACIRIAYLVAAARQALGEDWSPSEAIRAVAQDRDRYDGNFSRIWDEIDGKGLSTRGVARSPEIKLNGGGFERAGRIARELALAAK